MTVGRSNHPSAVDRTKDKKELAAIISLGNHERRENRMTTAELLAAFARECHNGVSFDPMTVRLLRQKIPFEDWQIEDLKAAMLRLGNGLWFSREMNFGR